MRTSIIFGVSLALLAVSCISVKTQLRGPKHSPVSVRVEYDPSDNTATAYFGQNGQTSTIIHYETSKNYEVIEYEGSIHYEVLESGGKHHRNPLSGDSIRTVRVEDPFMDTEHLEFGHNDKATTIISYDWGWEAGTGTRKILLSGGLHDGSDTH